MDSENPSLALRINQQPSSGGSPSSTYSPKMTAPGSSYANLDALRPPNRTIHSSQPLLNDSSAANSPMQEAFNPFEDHNPRPHIQINSEPNSPASVDIPSFNPDHHSPFGDRSPFEDHEPQHDDDEAHSDEDHPEGISSSRAPMSTAERRSNRMKPILPSLRSAKSGKSNKSNKAPKITAGKGIVKRAPFQSTRLKGEIYKPWLEKKDPAQRWARWITLASIVLGFAIAGISELFREDTILTNSLL